MEAAARFRAVDRRNRNPVAASLLSHPHRQVAHLHSAQAVLQRTQPAADGRRRDEGHCVQAEQVPALGTCQGGLAHGDGQY